MTNPSNFTEFKEPEAIMTGTEPDINCSVDPDFDDFTAFMQDHLQIIHIGG